MNINIDYLLDETYKALTAATAFVGYTPAVVVSKGPREINSTSKTYSMQIIPSRLAAVPETLDGTESRTLNFDVQGILLTNDTELLDGSAGRKSLPQFIEDTLAALNTVRKLSDSEHITKIDFTGVDIDYQYWPFVVFTISITATYEHKY